jgi:hypothetical protein
MLHLETRQVVHLPTSVQSRLTYRRLRRPTRLPTAPSHGAVHRYLDRLRWLFAGA